MSPKELLQLEWKDPKMVDHCLKNSVYVPTTDGAFIDAGDPKPRIESDMWYSDVTEGPDASKFESFRDYNLRSNKLPMLGEVTEYGGPREIWLGYQYNGNKAENRLLCINVQRVDEPPRGHYLRRATADEIIAVNKARAEINANYEKRLATYWKRYSKNVHACGYWADR